MANKKPNIENLNSYKSKWNLGKTKTIRVPIAIEKQILSIAHEIDKYQKKEIKDINLASIFDSNKQLNKNKKYKVGIECLEEYFREKGISLSELQAARAGTKKRQLAEIHEWLSKKSN